MDAGTLGSYVSFGASRGCGRSPARRYTPLQHTLATHPINAPPLQHIFQHTLQHALSMHPFSTPPCTSFLSTSLSIRPLNASFQCVFFSNLHPNNPLIHPHNLPSPQEHWHHDCMLMANMEIQPPVRWSIVSWVTSVLPCMPSSLDGCCMVNWMIHTKSSL